MTHMMFFLPNDDFSFCIELHTYHWPVNMYNSKLDMNYIEGSALLMFRASDIYDFSLPNDDIPFSIKEGCSVLLCLSV